MYFVPKNYVAWRDTARIVAHKTVNRGIIINIQRSVSIPLAVTLGSILPDASNILL